MVASIFDSVRAILILHFFLGAPSRNNFRMVSLNGRNQTWELGHNPTMMTTRPHHFIINGWKLFLPKSEKYKLI